MSEIPTTRVQHPDDPRRYMIVNAADAHCYTPWMDPATADAPPLATVPTRALAAAIAEVVDAAVLRAAMDADTRTSARALYERRLAEIEGDGRDD